MSLESTFQSRLIKKLEKMFPAALVFKNDANYRQGYPDLSIHFSGGEYALLECKRSKGAKEQQNQRYYIEKLNANGGFGRFIYPENEEEVLNELQRAFESYGPPCLSVSK